MEKIWVKFHIHPKVKYVTHSMGSYPLHHHSYTVHPFALTGTLINHVVVQGSINTCMELTGFYTAWYNGSVQMFLRNLLPLSSVY